MIRIDKDNLDKSDLKCFRKAAKFAMDKFLTKSQQNKMTIFIDFNSDNHLNNKWQGECSYIGYENGRKRFNVTLRNTIDNRAKNTILRRANTLRTLFHEMTHVKQYMCGELFDYANGNVKHQGYVYENFDYWDCPWEIEAYGMSETMFHQFYQQNWQEFEAL